ncbi:hypothetical protein ABMA28_004614 [Loxostege sticticalis]|uniref:Neuropeptide-like 4 n=1 Tax=Loxostege sticticalis TaxID=481309 RepID=A0ABD0SRU2_LOXSC
MFAKIFALFALLAVAFAAPKPAPAPQVLTYSAGLDYVYPSGAYAAPAVVSPYAAAPLAYSALPNAYYY